jgi:hypothetical protein
MQQHPQMPAARKSLARSTLIGESLVVVCLKAEWGSPFGIARAICI